MSATVASAISDSPLVVGDSERFVLLKNIDRMMTDLGQGRISGKLDLMAASLMALDRVGSTAKLVKARGSEPSQLWAETNRKRFKEENPDIVAQGKEAVSKAMQSKWEELDDDTKAQWSNHPRAKWDEPEPAPAKKSNKKRKRDESDEESDESD